MSTPEGEIPAGIWPGDEGELHFESRRALVQLIKGPYLSGEEMPRLWTALSVDEQTIRSRLNDLFLNLEIDPENQFAFVKSVEVQDVPVPKTLQVERLKFLDTAMLLLLRQHLLAAPGERNVFVDKDEIIEALDPYRQTDMPTFRRNANGAWNRLARKYGLLHVSSGSDRARISPMVRFLIDADSVGQLTALYEGIAEGNAAQGAEETAQGTENTAQDAKDTAQTVEDAATDGKSEATDD